jgi:hypothetical protein
VKSRPHVGARVRAPFGLGEVEGKVFRVEGKGDLTWVTVEFFLHGNEKPMLNTFLLKELRAA